MSTTILLLLPIIIIEKGWVRVFDLKIRSKRGYRFHYPNLRIDYYLIFLYCLLLPLQIDLELNHHLY